MAAQGGGGSVHVAAQGGGREGVGGRRPACGSAGGGNDNDTTPAWHMGTAHMVYIPSPPYHMCRSMTHVPLYDSLTLSCMHWHWHFPACTGTGTAMTYSCLSTCHMPHAT